VKSYLCWYKTGYSEQRNMSEGALQWRTYTHCDIRLFRLGRCGLDPRVEHRNAGLFEVTGITRDDR
jgi:hypothetical protein